MTEVAPKLTTGSYGESLVRVAFQRIGWAPPAKIDQDIGDDLMTFARDKSVSDQPDVTYDLSAPVFMQVKSSPTEYLTPTHTLKGRSGWWFTEPDTDHFDHWLMFGLPYLLVLQDTKHEIAYWVHVTNPSIVTTGKGRKIFVPADQRVEDSLEALNAIATAHRSNPLEGSAWAGAFVDLTPAALLRNALIMPRLVAPHPNRPPAKITYEQAVAMLLRNRGSDLRHLADKGFCPAPTEWESHKRWGWRFVAAIQAVVTGTDSTALDVLATASDPKKLAYERDACNVVRACVAHTEDRTSDAVSMLGIQRYTKPADRGWLHAHRAHMLLELDQPKAAAMAAQDALVALKALDGDLSVSAIRGGCAAILYSVAGYGVGDLEKTISAQDNAGSWWRAQDVSYALGRDLTARFNGWAGDRSIRFASSDALSELNSAAWNAAFSATWGSWRHLTFQIAQLVFTTTNEPASVGVALNQLAQTGQKSETRDAANNLWAGGPLTSLQTVVTAFATNPWPKRAEGPAMAVFANGGDLLVAELADHVVARILGVLETDGPVRQHSGGWANRWSEIDSALSRLLSAASMTSHNACAELISSNFGGPISQAACLVRIASHLQLPALGGEMLTRLHDAATSRDDLYRLQLLELLGPHHITAVETLRGLADAGSVPAFRSLLIVGSTAKEDFLALGRSAGAAVQQSLADAARLAYGHGSNDDLLDLALAAFHTGSNRLWKQVTDALAAGTLPKDQVYLSVEMLAQHFTELPPHVQGRLRKMAPSLTAVDAFFGGANNFAGAVTALMVAAGIPSDLEILNAFLKFRRTDPAALVKLLSLWSTPHNRSFLTILSVDPDPQVRAAAAFGVVDLASRNPEHATEMAALMTTALNLSDGVLMHRAVAQALEEYPSPAFDAIRIQLKDHPSALVRNHLNLASPSRANT
jgi:Domain of unknown function (DUF4365)